MNKFAIASIVVVVGLVGFFGGMKYQGTKGNSLAAAGRRFGQNTNGNGQVPRGALTGGAVVGDVIAKDATSITVKLMDGGSRIVLLSPSTSIEKTASGSLDDLIVGKSVLVRGSQNTDGSVTAQSIQLQRFMVRPRGSPIPSAAPSR